MADLWCDKHSKGLKLYPPEIVAEYTKALIQRAFETINPETKDLAEAVGTVWKSAPLCCFLGDQEVFNVRMKTTVRVRGVMFLSRRQYDAVQSERARRARIQEQHLAHVEEVHRQERKKESARVPRSSGD